MRRHGAHDEAREAVGQDEADVSAAKGSDGAAGVGGKEEEGEVIGGAERRIRRRAVEGKPSREGKGVQSCRAGDLEQPIPPMKEYSSG